MGEICAFEGFWGSGGLGLRFGRSLVGIQVGVRTLSEIRAQCSRSGDQMSPKRAYGSCCLTWDKSMIGHLTPTF